MKTFICEEEENVDKENDRKHESDTITQPTVNIGYYRYTEEIRETFALLLLFWFSSLN